MEIGHICAKSIFGASRQWDIRQNRRYLRHFALVFRQNYEFIRQANYFKLPGNGISAKIGGISAILQYFSAKVMNLSAEPSF
ncbi:hypothetical protein [Ureibacillus sp. FSL K6-3587]|uniref:hypothetical protein n=1 Tax=Ureibacillus sp. FSL K6-3587 TaxID=2954681 RepID=UPI0031583CC1